MNNDNDLNLHSMTKLSGWLRCWLSNIDTINYSNPNTFLQVADFTSQIQIRDATMSEDPEAEANT